MEGGNVQKMSALPRELTRVFSSYNKSSALLKKNLKETSSFFKEMRQHYSNMCTAGDLEQGEMQDHTVLSLSGGDDYFSITAVHGYSNALALMH